MDSIWRCRKDRCKCVCRLESMPSTWMQPQYILRNGGNGVAATTDHLYLLYFWRIVMVCLVHQAVERQHYCRASLVDDDSILVRFGCLEDILDHAVLVYRVHVSVICHKSWHCTVNSHYAKRSSISVGLPACRRRKWRRKSIFSWIYCNYQLLRVSWKIWAAVNSDEWVWLQPFCTVCVPLDNCSINWKWCVV